MVNRYRNYFILALCGLLLAAPLPALAQYTGQPVQRDRLIEVLRSKRFQSRDVVQIINENGVDFKMSPLIENQLVSAGARPAVLDAVRKNYRNDKSANTRAKANTGSGATRPDDYNKLLNEAINTYEVKKDKAAAITLLQRAVSLQTGNPRAYQLLGYLGLYANRNFEEAEGYWKKSIALGGNAVLRVIHDHDGSFITSCEGSLYISKNTVRYESDNNDHTFETSDANIKKIEVNNKWRRLIQLKGGSFKILLKDDEGETKYNFAPLSGKADESKMIIRLIGK